MATSGFHVNPFPGIRSYDISEDELFFGREHQILELVERLSATRFLAIVGSSGCGKSSLIRAGLIPALIRKKTDRFEGDWDLFITKPGSDPIGNLARNISNHRNGKQNAEAILRSDSRGLIRLLGEDTRRNMTLLVIDQFEELFRYKNPQAAVHTLGDATLFVNLLMEAIHEPDAAIYIVLTMRTDFLDDCTEFRDLSEAINRGYYLVPRMNDQERSMVITGPIKYKNAEITPELVSQLMQDVGDNPDHLPILQHALMRTWNYWSLNRIGDQPVGIEHYEAIGTMKEALSIHLEEIYEELREPRLRYIAEKLFKALTDPGPDNRGIRRPALLGDLCTLTEASEEEVIRVIDAFREPGRAFLMPPNNVRLHSGSTIDISHESIMRVWKRLKGWVEEQNRSAQLYMRLARSAELYQAGMTGLWVNPELQLALQWKELNKPNATWARRYDPNFDRAMAFLEYSRKQHDLETARKENQQARNLRMARNFAIILGTASLISILFLVISLNLRFKADASRKEAMEKQAQAEAERKRTEAQRKEAILQRRISSQQQEVAEQQKIITEQQRQYAVAQQFIAMNQTRIAVAERTRADEMRSEAVQARDDAEQQRQEAVVQKVIADQEREKAEKSEENTRRLSLLAVARSLSIQSAQLSASGPDELSGLLALQAYRFNQENGGNDPEADIFHALSLNGDLPVVLRGHRDAVRGMALTSTGKTLYSCSDDGQILSWNLANPESGTPILLPKNRQEKFRAITLLKGDQQLAAAAFSGRIYIFSLTGTNEAPEILTSGSAVIHDIAADPLTDGFASVGADGRLLIWKKNEHGYMPVLADSCSGILRSVAYHPSGTSLAYAGDDGVLKVLDLSGKQPVQLSGLTKGIQVFPVTFSPDGQRLAAGMSDGTILLWNINTPDTPPVRFIGSHQAGILALAFSEDSKLFFAGGYDRMVTFQDAGQPEEKAAVAGSLESWVYRILTTPGGNKALACGADRTIVIFRTNSADLATRIQQKTKRNLTRSEWDKFIGSDIPYEKTVPELP